MNPDWQGTPQSSRASALPSSPELSWGNKHCKWLWKQQRDQGSLVWKRSFPLKKNMLMQGEPLLWDFLSRSGGARWRVSSVSSVSLAGEKFESSKNSAAVLGNEPTSLFDLVFSQLSCLILEDLTRSTRETHKHERRVVAGRTPRGDGGGGAGMGAFSRGPFTHDGKMKVLGLRAWLGTWLSMTVFLLHFNTQSPHLACLGMQQQDESIAKMKRRRSLFPMKISQK